MASDPNKSTGRDVGKHNKFSDDLRDADDASRGSTYSRPLPTRYAALFQDYVAILRSREEETRSPNHRTESAVRRLRCLTDSGDLTISAESEGGLAQVARIRGIYSCAFAIERHTGELFQCRAQHDVFERHSVSRRF